MIQDIYIRIFNLLKSPHIALVLSYIFNMLYRTKYCILKLFRKRTIIKLNACDADKFVSSIYCNRNRVTKFINKETSQNIDLSIIIPVYNYAENLEKNIETYINQRTKYKYEIIFINDGSTDSSLAILNKYIQHPNVIVIDKENGGAASARNVGIEKAAGKYIMFVDCDDALHNDIVEKLLSVAFDTCEDIVMCAHNLIKTSNGRIVSKVPYVYPNKNLLSYRNSDIIMNYPGFPWGKVYKKDLFNNIRFPEGYWYEDTIILFLLFTQCKSFKYIDEPLYDYYIHGSNITNIVSDTKNVKVIDRYWILLDIIDCYRRNNFHFDAQFYELLLRHVSLFYYSNIKNLDKDVVEALFVLARDLVLNYKPKEKVKLSYMLRQVEKSFINNDISLWKLASMYQ